MADNLWVVCIHNNNNKDVLYEGCKTQCKYYIKTNYGVRAYKKGKIKLAKVNYKLKNIQL